MAAALHKVGYLPDEGIATAAFLALRMQRPLFCEGEPGTGKTALATALAQALELPMVRLQCHEGIDASQALYDWDFPRQLLHLRALEASGDQVDDAELYTERFLLARPLLQALRTAPCVLLVDEIDRADDEFEAFLLEVLAENKVSIPELGEIRAVVPPLVVLTSNRTRACTTGWSTPTWPARSPSCGSGCPRCPRSWPGRCLGPAGPCAPSTCSNPLAWRRPWTGPRRCTRSAVPQWMPRRPRRRWARS